MLEGRLKSQKDLGEPWSLKKKNLEILTDYLLNVSQRYCRAQKISTCTKVGIRSIMR